MDPVAHDRYLDIIASAAGPLGDAMGRMGIAAGVAARSPSPRHLEDARGTFVDVQSGASAFLHRLAGSRAPHYLRGADGQLQDALKLIVDGAQRGVTATDERDGARLAAAAKEIDDATKDIVEAAGRITGWRSGQVAP